MDATIPGIGGLVVVCTHADEAVHLAVPAERASLCGQAVDTEQPARSFRLEGCPPCLLIAQGVGYLYVLDGNYTWLNLQRLSSDDIGRDA